MTRSIGRKGLLSLALRLAAWFAGPQRALAQSLPAGLFLGAAFYLISRAFVG